MASAADIEQMNKLRKSLGLPLLSVSGQPPPTSEGPSFKESSRSDDSQSEGEPASTLETREAAGYENWKKVQEDERRRIEREKRKKEIQRKRDLEARDRLLEGKGLGDADDNELDTKAWLKGQKKRQSNIERERADRLEREFAEREREAAVQYTAKDLAGVQVAHEIGDFEDGTDEQILTLQDKEIGKGDDSDDEDVLENAALVAKDKLKDKLDLKKKKKVYDVNDDSEQGLLAQYDDKKRKAFTLDAQGSSLEERESKRQQIGEKLKNTISLDILNEEPISDYLELKIKKPKKEKKKSKRQRLADDDEDGLAVGNNGDAMDVDTGAGAQAKATSRTAEDNFNDDDDLAKALAQSRQKVLKKQKRRPEDIIKQLKEEEEQEAAANGTTEGGIVLDETTVFLDNLRPRSASPERTIKKSVETDKSESPAATQDEVEDQVMAGVEDENDILERVKRERSETTPEVSTRGLEEEKTLDQGLGAALGLLKQRGLIKETDADSKNRLYKDRQQFIINARLRENENEQRARMQRERDRQSGKFNTMSAKEREEHARWQNSQREHQSSIQAAATFNREYKPDVQIKYVDDDGRLMNQKEAFKHLSHQFHGKGSGKLKTEKHLKKIEDEKKREATSVLDSSKATGMNNAGGFMGKKNREAGVRLQ
jgi:U4/U6.U5 tri-snRNP-associated protein 1